MMKEEEARALLEQNVIKGRAGGLRAFEASLVLESFDTLREKLRRYENLEAGMENTEAHNQRLLRERDEAREKLRGLEEDNERLNGRVLEAESRERFDRTYIKQVEAFLAAHPSDIVYADGRICWAHREGQWCCMDDLQAVLSQKETTPGG